MAAHPVADYAPALTRRLMATATALVRHGRARHDGWCRCTSRLAHVTLPGRPRPGALAEWLACSTPRRRGRTSSERCPTGRLTDDPARDHPVDLSGRDAHRATRSPGARAALRRRTTTTHPLLSTSHPLAGRRGPSAASAPLRADPAPSRTGPPRSPAVVAAAPVDLDPPAGLATADLLLDRHGILTRGAPRRVLAGRVRAIYRCSASRGGGRCAVATSSRARRVQFVPPAPSTGCEAGRFGHAGDEPSGRPVRRVRDSDRPPLGAPGFWP